MMMPLNQFLTELHQRAVKDGIAYCFLHDVLRHSRLDEATRSQPQIVISNQDVPKLLSHISDMDGIHIIDLNCNYDGYSFAVYGIRGRDELKTKRFTIRTKLCWSGAEFSFIENVIDRAQLFEQDSLQINIAHPMDQTIISFFYSFLNTGTMQKSIWPYWREVVSSMTDTAEKRFTKIFGKTHGLMLSELIKDGNKSEVYTKINLWRKHFFRQAWQKDGVSMLLQNLRFAFFHVKRFIVTDKQYIAFYGVDGAGKTTAVFDIYDHLKAYRDTVEIRHLKPSLISPKAPDKGRVQNNPHAHSKRNTVASITKIVFYFIIYWADRFCLTTRKRLSLYDRFMPDMYVDMKRYRLHPKSEKFLKFALKYLPQPLLSIIMNVDLRLRMSGRKSFLSRSQLCRLRPIKT